MCADGAGQTEGAGDAAALTGAEDEDAEGNDAVADNRASSVCDRLRNMTARVVVQVHRLMGDPTVVGLTGTDEARARYFSALDEHAAKALGECKLWMGGAQYLGKQCESNHSRLMLMRCHAFMQLFLPASM
jgi:hypothetical protein